VFMCVLVTAPPPITHRPHRTESVCSRSLAGIVGSKLARSRCLSFVHVECFEVELYGPGCSILQRGHSGCGVMVSLNYEVALSMV
jgi:hypothetical protein